MSVIPHTQRMGTLSRLDIIPEADGPGVDPASPEVYTLPLSGQTDYGVTQNLEEVPVFEGGRFPFSRILGMLQAGGGVPLQMEYKTAALLWRLGFGPGGYLRIGDEHNFFIPPTDASDQTPTTCQLQAVFTEATAQYIRTRYNQLGSMNFSYSGPAGVAGYTANFTGSGDYEKTASGGTHTVYGVPKGTSLFNGYVYLDGERLSGMTEFSANVDFGVSRQDVFFNDGIAGALNAGNINAGGRVGVLFAKDGSAIENNLRLMELGESESTVKMDCAWSDKKVAIADAWMRMRFNSMQISLNHPRPGGAAGLMYGADWNLTNDTSDSPAEVTGSVNDFPVTVPSSSNLGVKFEGGSTVTVPVAADDYTAEELVAVLNAFGGFSAAGVADVHFGRVRITTKSTLGATSSVQIDTATSGSIHALLGFDGTVRTGWNTPLLITIKNGISTDMI